MQITIWKKMLIYFGDWKTEWLACKQGGFWNPNTGGPKSIEMVFKITPLKFNIAPEKWWLEDYFPIGKATFQGLC